jgi:hypothetical protein
VFADSVLRVIERVPEYVTGLPETVKIGDVDRSERDTEVTVPEPPPPEPLVGGHSNDAILVPCLFCSILI